MKKLSKVLVLVLSAIMVLAMSASVFAGTIEVKDVLDGETYTAYKILNYTDNGKTGNERAVSYYLTAEQYDANADGTAKDGGLGDILEDAGFVFTKSADGTQYFVSNTSDLTTSGVSEVAAKLAVDTRLPGKALVTKTATGADGSAVFPDLGTGYYFVTSTAGSLCALHEDGGIATVVEKNTVPTVDKKEKTTGESYVDGPVDANIGDTVHYQIKVTDGTGTDKAITITDTLSDGLDYTAGTIKINGTAVTDDADTTDWKVTVNGRTITIIFKDAYVKTIDTGGEIFVTYDATINKDAIIDRKDNPRNDNKIELDYSEQHSEDTVYVETYDFQLKKTDGETFLPDSGFRLYDAATNGNEIKLAKDNTGYYRSANGNEEILVNVADGVNVRGLAPGTYYLEETTVPDGYNKLANRKEVTITNGATGAVEVTVVNEKGTALPSTGGIGTTIFYIVGSLLVIGCGIVLVSRRRMNNK